eukprot:GHVU01230846.1.p1 GENE.GHVU01230846.1~~GHVU01230846.1.p1  ORF type:complete len:291 (-),score=53.13 GHVU01230846.1:150-1022(-)
MSDEKAARGTSTVKQELARMLVGGVIMDVTSVEQARMAANAGACAVMVVPVNIRGPVAANGGVVRMADPEMISLIKKSVSIPVMAKCRLGHFVEAQILQAIGCDYVDESEVLTVADADNRIDKRDFVVPFVCGCCNLGEALRRIAEGASMLRTKGEARTGDIVEAVRHIRTLKREIKLLQGLEDVEVFSFAQNAGGAPVELVQDVKKLGRLPVVCFAAGGVVTPADAALCMQLGADGVVVGSGIFQATNPKKRASAIVTVRLPLLCASPHLQDLVSFHLRLCECVDVNER